VGKRRPDAPVASGFFVSQMSNEDDKQEKRGFKVEDRRRFSDSGDARPETQSEARERPVARGDEPAEAAAPPPQSQQQEAALPLNFSTFILGLSTQALVHLGEIPNPMDDKVATDLLAAKHMIDILGILKEKTKGNLDNSESGLLDTILYDLRLRYVERVRGRS
jgi:hypothetical protein